MNIVCSPQSLSDLDAIHEYSARDSERYADLTVARVFAAVEHLVQFAQSGRTVKERDDPGIREIIGRFRVVYRIRHTMVEVATVFRASSVARSRLLSMMICIVSIGGCDLGERVLKSFRVGGLS